MPLFPIQIDLANEPAQKLALSIGVPVVTTVLSFIAGRLWGAYRARKQWLTKDFSSRIIVSMNLLNEGRLRIRTVLERPLDEVFPNALAASKIREASLRTTQQNPMLPMSKQDCWYLLNFVLNVVAEHFAQGVVKLDAGVPVAKVAYALFLTCEVVGEERIRKVRAMMLRKELLEDFPYLDEMPELENPWHSDRVLTLRHASQTFKTNPEQFLFLEVCV